MHWNKRSALLFTYIVAATPICLRLDMHLAARADSFAFWSTGKSIAARMAMIATTTRSSIRVNAARELPHRFEALRSALDNKFIGFAEAIAISDRNTSPSPWMALGSA